jgi:transposase
MAGVRRSGREPGKSDPIDALAVARAVLREPDLPVATLDGPDRQVRLLVDHREDLVGERTRHEQRLRWFLVELAIANPLPGHSDGRWSRPRSPRRWRVGPNRWPASPAICWSGSSS